MSDAERILLVDACRLDVWYLLAENAREGVPEGWVVDLGEADPTLWKGYVTEDGGTALVVGSESWREAVDKAADALRLLGRIP